MNWNRSSGRRPIRLSTSSFVCARSSGAATTFSSDGGTSVVQNEGPRIIIARVENQEVLAALTKLTSTTFGFDQRAWRLWYDQEKRAQATKEQTGERRE